MHPCTAIYNSPVHESNIREDLEEDCIDIHQYTSRGPFRRADIQLAKQMTVQDAQYKMEVVNTDEGTVILHRRVWQIYHLLEITDTIELQMN